MLNLRKKAFTLIELLVVIAIIGILATLAVVALQQARQNARDSKRMADMKQIHTALELFYYENSRYPTTAEWNSGTITSSSSQEVFMYNIPTAPTPADGDCQPASNTYTYLTNAEGSTYTIDFCTGKQVSDLPQGAKQMTPGGIIFGASGETGGGGTPTWTCGDPFDDPRDDNIYPTVQIGGQCWMAKNLAYLPAVHNNTEFSAQGTNSLPGYGVYGYNGSVVADAKAYMHTAGNTFNMYQAYGVLYNFHAVNQTGENAICPPGWYVPFHDEWTDLERVVCTLLGNSNCETTFPKNTTTLGWIGTNEGKALKSERTAISSPEVGIPTNDHPRWNYNSTHFGTDDFDFNALSAGGRSASGSFGDLGSFSYLWSSSIDGSSAWYRRLHSSYSSVYRGNVSLDNGFSVRCLRTE